MSLFLTAPIQCSRHRFQSVPGNVWILASAEHDASAA